jgi:hypothetical protein
VGGAPIQNAFQSGFSIRSSLVPQAGNLNDLQLWGVPADSAVYHFNTSVTPRRYDPPINYIDDVDHWDSHPWSLRIGESFFLLAPSSGAISRVFTVN